MSDLLQRLNTVLVKEVKDTIRRAEILQKFCTSHRSRFEQKVAQKLFTVADEYDDAEQIRVIGLIFDQLEGHKREAEAAKKVEQADAPALGTRR